MAIIIAYAHMVFLFNFDFATALHSRHFVNSYLTTFYMQSSTLISSLLFPLFSSLPFPLFSSLPFPLFSSLPFPLFSSLIYATLATVPSPHSPPHYSFADCSEAIPSVPKMFFSSRKCSATESACIDSSLQTKSTSFFTFNSLFFDAK